MKFTFGVSGGRRGMWAALVGLMLASAPCNAVDISWSNTLGSVTLYGSGSAATTLQTLASLGGDTAENALNYGDGASSPVTSKSEIVMGGGSFTALASLGVDESQVTGLPFISGSIGFAGANGTGSGEIKLYLVINVPSPVTISLSEVRSVVMTMGMPADAFSLALYQSNAAGVKSGGALLYFSGNLFDQAGSYQSSASYYMLEMSVAANTAASFSGSAQFSFALDLLPATAVPEPRTTSLLVIALLGIIVPLSRKGRQAASRR